MALIETPVIAEAPAMRAAAIHLTIPRHEIQNVMGPGIGEIFATLQAQGIAPAGAWFTHHRRMEPGTFDFEICVPVARPVAPAGRVTPIEFAARRVAQTVYSGPYERLGEAWGEFDAWMRQQRLTQAEDLFESYAVGPESGLGASHWRTELRKPLL